MIEYILFCMGIIMVVCLAMAIILDYKLKQHERKEFNKNLNRYKNDKDRL